MNVDWKLVRQTILVLAFGVFLIYMGTSPEWLGWIRDYYSPRLISEVGTAFIIAGIITFAYESQARERFAKATVEDVLAKVMGDIVNPGIWREMREQLLKKVAVRNNTTVRFRLSRPDGMEKGRCVLGVALDYRLTSLRSDEQCVKVLHFVDKFMEDPKLLLPRLRRVEIAGVTQPLKDVYKFEEDVDIPGRDGAGKRVVVDRDEIVYVPGAYNLLMSELTELEIISLIEVPDDVHVTVSYFFKPQGLTTQRALLPGRFFLPGQSVEVRFEPRADAP